MGDDAINLVGLTVVLNKRIKNKKNVNNGSKIGC